jgi:hypothetical protein
VIPVSSPFRLPGVVHAPLALAPKPEDPDASAHVCVAPGGDIDRVLDVAQALATQRPARLGLLRGGPRGVSRLSSVSPAYLLAPPLSSM